MILLDYIEPQRAQRAQREEEEDTALCILIEYTPPQPSPW